MAAQRVLVIAPDGVSLSTAAQMFPGRNIEEVLDETIEADLAALDPTHVYVVSSPLGTIFPVKEKMNAAASLRVVMRTFNIGEDVDPGTLIPIEQDDLAYVNSGVGIEAFGWTEYGLARRLWPRAQCSFTGDTVDVFTSMHTIVFVYMASKVFAVSEQFDFWRDVVCLDMSATSDGLTVRCVFFWRKGVDDNAKHVISSRTVPDGVTVHLIEVGDDGAPVVDDTVDELTSVIYATVHVKSAGKQ